VRTGGRGLEPEPEPEEAAIVLVPKTSRILLAGLLFAGAAEVPFPGGAFAADGLECARCKTAAITRFSRRGREINCESPPPPAEAGRLRAAFRHCEARHGCDASNGDVEAVLETTRRFIEGVEAEICPCGTEGGRRDCPPGAVPGWGEAIDPGTVQGPVGLVPPASSSDEAASFAEVAAFCEAHAGGYDTPPPLLPLPETAELPEWCDESAAHRALADACGVPRVLVVARGADPGIADGSAGAPFASIGAAIAACAGPCHLLVGPGTYAESVRLPRCTILEGGVAVSDGVVTAGAERPRIEGDVWASDEANLIARVEIEDEYGALQADHGALVVDSVLRGGYEGGSAAWSARGPRICRTRIAGGYAGIDIAWESSQLWIAGSAISACYEGAALSWGSRGLKVLDSNVYGHLSAVGTSWGSFGVEVRGSRLGGGFAAVDVHDAPNLEMGLDGPVEVWPESFDVSVTGNRIASGTLPESDASLGITVEGNTFE
jgi:hypothetical protein